MRRPPLGLLALEAPRAAAELALFGAARPLLARAPRGDGHPVLVLPGFTADDASTAVLRRFLRGLGYYVHGWRLGRNLPGPHLAERLQARLAELTGRHAEERLSVVGWSLGGIYAREIARRAPDRVRQVITLGSPFRDVPGEESHPNRFVRRFSDRPVPRSVDQSPLAVPSTAIFSRSDGVVPWRASRGIDGPDSESVEVVGSHVGLGHHPAVLWVVADRLAQPAGTWAPFTPPRGARWRALFPTTRGGENPSR